MHQIAIVFNDAAQMLVTALSVPQKAMSPETLADLKANVTAYITITSMKDKAKPIDTIIREAVAACCPVDTVLRITHFDDMDTLYLTDHGWDGIRP